MTLEEKHNWYLKTKRPIGFHFIKAYDKKDWDGFLIELDSFIEAYKYIYSNLENEALKLEFRFDTIDHINKVYNQQRVSKFKQVLSEKINYIKKNKNEVSTNFSATELGYLAFFKLNNSNNSYDKKSLIEELSRNNGNKDKDNIRKACDYLHRTKMSELKRNTYKKIDRIIHLLNKDEKEMANLIIEKSILNSN